MREVGAGGVILGLDKKNCLPIRFGLETRISNKEKCLALWKLLKLGNELKIHKITVFRDSMLARKAISFISGSIIQKSSFNF